MSTQWYQTPDQSQHEPPPSIAPRDQDVLRSRAISLDVAIKNGLRTRTGREMEEFGFHGDHARDGLHIPWRNTQNIISGEQLRPHDPPVKETTRADGSIKHAILKYLFLSGAKMSIYVPLESSRLLGNPDVPLIVTESALKALAIVSNIEPDTACVIAISGVWGYRTKTKRRDGYIKTSLPEHKNGISWGVVDRNGRVRKRRLVSLVFDSDVLTNSMVSRARWEYTDLLKDLGADVRWIDVPTTPTGEKQGVDDDLAASSDARRRLVELITSAYRAPEDAPELAYAGPGDPQTQDVEYWRSRALAAERRSAQQSRTISHLVYINRDKAIAPTDKAIAVATLAEAHAKRARGEIEPDGRVRLESRHIANDHRPIVPKGVAKPETNNDGSYPITDRKRVKGILTNLRDAGAMEIETVKTIKTHRATGDRYPDTDILVTVSDDISLDLAKITAHTRPKKARERYTKQQPCQSCGEIHDRTHRTYCDGCGGEYEPAKHIPVAELHVVNDDYSEADTPADTAMEKNGMARNGDVAPASVPITYLLEKDGMAPDTPADTATHRVDSRHGPPLGFRPEDIWDDVWRGA